MAFKVGRCLKVLVESGVCLERNYLLDTRPFILKVCYLNAHSQGFRRELPPELPRDRFWHSEFSSLGDRGFLRPIKGYNAPPNVKEIITDICLEILGKKSCSGSPDVQFDDGIVRYKILTSCIERFKHDIPNYELHKITSVGESWTNNHYFVTNTIPRLKTFPCEYQCRRGSLIMYFEKSVEARNPYDILSSGKSLHDGEPLPPNIHVQADYVRFHPETDTAFGGITAFPGESTIVTGLKYKKKYRGFKDESVFPNID